MLSGEFGIVYKGCLTGKYTDEIVAIKTLKGEQDKTDSACISI